MNAILAWLRRLWSGDVHSRPPPLPSPTIIVSDDRVMTDPPPTAIRLCWPRVRRRRRLVMKTEPSFATIHEWMESDGTYRGMYRVGRRRWHGHAVREASGQYRFFIVDPPSCLRGHPCFHHQGNGVYFVHFHAANPRTIAAGIAAVEYEIASRLHRAEVLS